jgi:hypothetical protein
MLVDVIHQSQTENDVEVAELAEVEAENILRQEAVTACIYLLDLEDEVGLIYVHLSSINAQNEVGAVLYGAERPESGVAAEIQNSLARERPSRKLH